MRIRFLWIIVVAAMLPGLALAQTNVVVPHFTDGIAGPYRWQTTLLIQNQEQTQSQVRLQFFGFDGQAIQLRLERRQSQGPGPNFQAGTDGVLDLPPLGARLATRYRTMSAGPIQTGWIRIQSQTRLQVHVIFHLYDAAGNLLEETSAAPGPLFQSANIPIERGPQVTTGVAICNPSALTVTVTLDFYSEDATLLGTVNVTLGPQAHIARLVEELFPNFPTGIGHIVLTTSAPVCSLALNLRGIDIWQVPVFINP